MHETYIIWLNSSFVNTATLQEVPKMLPLKFNNTEHITPCVYLTFLMLERREWICSCAHTKPF